MPFKRGLLTKVNFVYYLFLLTSVVIFGLSAFLYLQINRRSHILYKDIERIEALQALRGDLNRLQSHLYEGDQRGFDSLLSGLERKALLTGLPVEEISALRALDRGTSLKRVSSFTVKVDDLIGKGVQELWATFEKEKRWLSGVFLFYLLLSLSGSLFIILGYYINLKKVLRPVEELTRAARAFADGRRDVKVPVVSQDELGELSRTFNQMAETIKTKEDSLVRLNNELEKRVKERTEELERAYKELKETQERLIQAERLALAGEFSSKVSHSILTPLSALVVNLQTLQSCFKGGECPGSVEECRKTLKLMEEELKRICHTVRRYGRFARSPQPLKREEVSIGDVINEALLLIFNKAERAGVSIERRYHDTPKVKVDRDRMREVFLNLSDNAIDAMEEGGNLVFETSFEGGKVAIRVSDNGCGMDERTLKDLFLPFRSTKPSGLGLGMSIVKQIVEAHGGEILCESLPGKGTTFTILLPVEGEGP